MKKLKIAIFLVIILMLFVTINVFAVSATITVNGDLIAKPGETKTLTVKLNSDTDIGLLSGKIQKKIGRASCRERV